MEQLKKVGNEIKQHYFSVLTAFTIECILYKRN